MKQEKINLDEELKGLQDGQPQYEQSHVDVVKKKLLDKDKKLKETIVTHSKDQFVIVDVKVFRHSFK